METAPKYRIWLDNDPAFENFRRYCPDGVPCRDFLGVKDDSGEGSDFVFSLDYDFLDDNQKRALFGWMEPEENLTELSNDKSFYHISSKEVIKVVDEYDMTFPPNVLEGAWLIKDNLSRFPTIGMQIDGHTIHLLISGLQQALFIEPDKESSMNDLFLSITIWLIKKLSNDDSKLKEAYVTGFPCEYITQARELLFS